MIDADLHEIAGDSARYAQNTIEVRREFRHLSYEEWIKGRKAFLEEFIRRARNEKLFHVGDNEYLKLRHERAFGS